MILKIGVRFKRAGWYGGEPAPTDWILHTRAYGLTIRSGTNNDGMAEEKPPEIIAMGAAIRAINMYQWSPAPSIALHAALRSAVPAPRQLASIYGA